MRRRTGRPVVRRYIRRKEGLVSCTRLINDAFVCWRLSENGAAVRVDSSRNGYHLIPNMPILKTEATQFDQQQHLLRDDTGGLFRITGDWEACCWVKVQNGTIFARGQAGVSQRGYALRVETFYPGFVWRLSANGTAYSDLACLPVTDLTDWHFVSCGLDTVNNVQFINVDNQTEIAKTLYSAEVAYKTESFTIGSQSGTNPWLDGQIKWLGIWQRLLTTDERNFLWNHGAGIEL